MSPHLYSKHGTDNSYLLLKRVSSFYSPMKPIYLILLSPRLGRGGWQVIMKTTLFVRLNSFWEIWGVFSSKGWWRRWRKWGKCGWLCVFHIQFYHRFLITLYYEKKTVVWEKHPGEFYILLKAAGIISGRNGINEKGPSGFPGRGHFMEDTSELCWHLPSLCSSWDSMN